MPENQTSTRHRRRSIVQLLRGQIVQGILQPGSKLPTRLEFEKALGASSATIQQAIDQLSRDGFILTRPRQGSFVADHPPHLCRFGILYPTANKAWWSLHWEAIERAAAGFVQPGRQFISFDVGIGGFGQESLHRLERQVEDHTLAGLLIVSPTGIPRESVVLTDPRLPRVLMGGGKPGMPGIRFDFDSFYQRGLERLRGMGCQRVAACSTGPMAHEKRPDPDVCAKIRQAGFETRPHWHFIARGADFPAAATFVDLLMDLPAGQRPDGLLVCDDNLIHHVCTAAARTQAGRELRIISHTNFPAAMPVSLPVIRLGFDCRQAIATSLEMFEAQRQGRAAAALADQPALFEDELASPVSPRSFQAQGTIQPLISTGGVS